MLLTPLPPHPTPKVSGFARISGVELRVGWEGSCPQSPSLVAMLRLSTPKDRLNTAHLFATGKIRTDKLKIFSFADCLANCSVGYSKFQAAAQFASQSAAEKIFYFSIPIYL